MKKIIIIIISLLVLIGVSSVSWYLWFNDKVVVTSIQGDGTTKVGQISPTIVEKPLTEEQKQAFADDHDLDGISNEKEKELGLSPTEFDTDRDGISDYVEINYSKTDPNKLDTDGDGYSDGLEILSGHDPLKK